MMKNCGFTTKNDEKLCFYLSIIVKKKNVVLRSKMVVVLLTLFDIISVGYSYNADITGYVLSTI